VKHIAFPSVRIYCFFVMAYRFDGYWLDLEVSDLRRAREWKLDEVAGRILERAAPRERETAP